MTASRLIAVLVALLLFPLLAVPLYLFAQIVGAELGIGIFEFPLVGAIGGPAALSFVVARRVLQVPVAVVVGFVSGAISLAALIGAILVYCAREALAQAAAAIILTKFLVTGRGVEPSSRFVGGEYVQP
jgi:hypothetical protein